MNIRKARQIAFDIGLGRSNLYTNNELQQAFHRLDRSQPELGNKMILRSDKAAAQDIFDEVRKRVADALQRGFAPRSRVSAQHNQGEK